jgi:SAM-dependent methyltransferase
VNLKEAYSINHSQIHPRTLHLNKRLFNTYNTIITKITHDTLSGTNIDLGSGDKGFSAICNQYGIISFPYDYPQFDIEKDSLTHENNSIDFITMNAVIEHIGNPTHILNEINRTLKEGGFLFIRTPNWQMDYKNFYNDPTHIKPYAPETLKNTLQLANFKVLFLEPGLIEKNWFWWELPQSIKWKIASYIKGGTKSILAVAQKKGYSNGI